MFQRNLDEEHEIQGGGGGWLGLGSGVVRGARRGEVRLPAAGQAGPLTTGVEEQSLTPGTAVGERIARVVDHGDAGALRGGEDGEHGRVSLNRLVVEEDWIEGGLA